jgi:hypothetical protein
MASYLYTRDAISDAKDTFSSWDKCMAKTYCKYVLTSPTAAYLF